MATKTFKIGLSNQDKTNMAQDVYERVLDLTFPEYDATASYSVGDFVVYENQLYKCIGATSGAWDSTKWQLATLNDILTDIEGAVAYVNDKANVDGNYPTMTVGNADQLNSTVYVVDKVPYLYRTSGGDADIGNREYDKIIGGSIVVNQVIKNGNFADTSVWYAYQGTLTVSNNIGSFISSTQFGSLANTFNTIIGHKYLYFVTCKLSSASGDIKYQIVAGSSYVDGQNKSFDSSTNKQSKGGLFAANNISTAIRVLDARESGFDAIQLENVMCFDLTQMFGSTIADYIYSLEQANAGAGVAWFRTYFQELYYPYNVGAIKSVKLVSHDMIGFNQWDEEWEVGIYNPTIGIKEVDSTHIRSKNFIKVLPNTVYYMNGTFTYGVCFYDENKNFISTVFPEYTNITTPSNCHYMTFTCSSSYGTTYNHDICINLSWSGWRNGQYEPYQKNSYPLDATIELRGIPKLDADNHLYFDGDEYSSDGKVVRKYGSYTFTGSETWVDIGADRYAYSGLASLVKIPSSSSVIANIMIAGLIPSTSANVNNVENGVAITSSGQVSIHSSSITSVAQAQTFMMGKTIVYELATIPEPETATPFQEPQIVDDFGTEEYVVPTQDGWEIPVGHDTKYPANLRDKLQRLPDMPSVSQNVTETYVVNYNGTTKKCTFVDIAGWLGTNGWIKLTDISGYDATKTQTLKNVEGTLTWVDD